MKSEVLLPTTSSFCSKRKGRWLECAGLGDLLLFIVMRLHPEYIIKEDFQSSSIWGCNLHRIARDVVIRHLDLPAPFTRTCHVNAPEEQ